MNKAADQQKATKTAGFFGIFIALLVIFLLAPLLAKSDHFHVLLQICFALLLISLSYSIYPKKWAPLVSGAIIFSFILFDALSLFFHSVAFMVTAYLIFDLFLFFAVVLLLKDVIFARKIDGNLIFGAMTAYMLVGILWGKLYFLNVLFFPESFHGLSGKFQEGGQLGVNFAIQFDLLYYSFTTLATLGLGDIAPAHHLSKTLTVLEAIFGQLFIAIVIAKLVGAWHRQIE